MQKERQATRQLGGCDDAHGARVGGARVGGVGTFGGKYPPDSWRKGLDVWINKSCSNQPQASIRRTLLMDKAQDKQHPTIFT